LFAQFPKSTGSWEARQRTAPMTADPDPAIKPRPHHPAHSPRSPAGGRSAKHDHERKISYTHTFLS
jgi:hypothetical protein